MFYNYDVKLFMRQLLKVIASPPKAGEAIPSVLVKNQTTK